MSKTHANSHPDRAREGRRPSPGSARRLAAAQPGPVQRAVKPGLRPARKGTPPSVPAGSLAMGTAGVPFGLDPEAARDCKPWDAFGSAGPIRASQAGGTLPTAAPTGHGHTLEELVRRSNFWRDNYNPLRGLTIAWLMARFEQAERGAFAETQLTLRKAEKRFPVLKGFIEKLLSSVAALDGKVRVKEQLPAGATPELAERQRRHLQGRYDLLKNFKASLAQIALADLRGYAVLQKHRYRGGGRDGAVEELYWIEPWCWVRDGFYGDFYYNENSQFGVGLGSCQAILGEDCRLGGGQLPRAEFVVREAEAPLYEIALIAFVNWLMGRKDYAAFTETFGLPSAIVTMPPNLAPGKEAEYQVVAERVARGASGALPAGADAKFPSQGIRGQSPFENFCDAQERDLVLAGTGGHLTMLSAPTGLGKGASEEHDAAWQKIAVAKAVQINDTLQRDFDAPELAAEFPGEPVCVYFALGVKDAEDVGALLDNVVKAEGVGLQTDAAEISERAGMKLARIVGGGPAPSQQRAGSETGAPPDPIASLAAKQDSRVDRSELNEAMRNRKSTDHETTDHETTDHQTSHPLIH
jgi:phage gp29-like protein